MNLLYRWIGEHKGWKATTLEKEKEYIRVVYPDLEEVKKRLTDREIIACSKRLYRLFDGVV